jgi:SAM-dependent methyltransferase
VADPPREWLTANASRIRPGGRVLDVACGRGRHALWLAARGFDVTALDRDSVALDAVEAGAARLGLEVRRKSADLEAEGVELGGGAWDGVVVISYLHRPLFPALRRALAPGGILIYETFTRAPSRQGGPRRPEFLLAPGELPQLVAPLEILAEREGRFEGRELASVVGRFR